MTAGPGTAPGQGTPFHVVRRHAVATPTTKSLLVARCRDLEREALEDPPDVVGVTLQDARHLTRPTLAVYAALAERGADVTLFGRGLHAWLAPGVRGVDLEDGDPLGDVWSVVYVSSRRPVALAALDLVTDGATDAERPFELAVSRDPEVVTACAGTLGLGAVSGRSGPGTPGT